MVPTRIYLDSSVIVKRYLQEKGTEAANLIYERCDSKEASIFFSFWNIGEALGAFDQYFKRKWITKQQHDRAVKTFSGECLRLLMLESLSTIPVNASVLSDTWGLVERYHIYQADALQIVSCKKSQADLFLSADRALLDVARKESLTSVDVESVSEVRSRFSS